jgi:hypothetical protein
MLGDRNKAKELLPVSVPTKELGKKPKCFFFKK